MNARKVSLMGFWFNPDPNVCEGGSISIDQTQYLPTKSELQHLINSDELSRYTVILVDKEEEEEYNQPNILLYKEVNEELENQPLQ